jgi:hypothetical protein
MHISYTENILCISGTTSKAIEACNTVSSVRISFVFGCDPDNYTTQYTVYLYAVGKDKVVPVLY